MMRIVTEPEAMARLEASMKESPMGEVRVPVRIANPFDTARHWEADFLVDTGASDSIVPTSVLESIGLTPRVVREVWLADGSMVRRLVGPAFFTVSELETFNDVIFGDDAVEPILGLPVLESLGLIVDPRLQRLLRRSALTAEHR